MARKPRKIGLRRKAVGICNYPRSEAGSAYTVADRSNPPVGLVKLETARDIA